MFEFSDGSDFANTRVFMLSADEVIVVLANMEISEF